MNRLTLSHHTSGKGTRMIILTDIHINKVISACGIITKLLKEGFKIISFNGKVNKLNVEFTEPMKALTLYMGMGGLFVHLGCLSYLTALAFSTILPIPIWGSLLLLNTVAVVYTISGGMKARLDFVCVQF